MAKDINNFKNRLIKLIETGERTTKPLLAIMIYIGLYAISGLTQVLGGFLAIYTTRINHIKFGTISSAIGSMIASVVGFGLPIVILFIWIKKYENRSLITIGFEKKQALFKFIRGFIIGTIIIASAIFLSIKFNMVEVAKGHKYINISNLLLVLPMYFVSYLFQGSAEEIQFRGFLMPILGKNYGIIIGVVLQAFLFIASHIFIEGATKIYFVFLLISTIVFALYALWDESLWGVCAMHGVYNLGFFTIGLDYMGLRDIGIEPKYRIANNLDAFAIPALTVLGIFLIISIIIRNKKHVNIEK
ncbi:CAAX protease self-immunity [Gottschalkia purinilytica]|uniref:CAAX protease self-immunity n=1 Tax=Gottschalkia purinilytica TaxID=1503 RepID=A0A0L0WBU7_GOTPU|nr:type II CAAX endopeptidase family protein [Gottschalkia purinilytica]KNF08932.1 CAAX protease self-immunity [Gottschalkia purinilytica]